MAAFTYHRCYDRTALMKRKLRLADKKGCSFEKRLHSGSRQRSLPDRMGKISHVLREH